MWHNLFFKGIMEKEAEITMYCVIVPRLARICNTKQERFPYKAPKFPPNKLTQKFAVLGHLW